MTLKFEFDTWEEYSKAMEHLEDYHDCDLCRGKIVCIASDGKGGTKCAYCNMTVRYPKMAREAFEKMIKEELKQDRG